MTCSILFSSFFRNPSFSFLWDSFFVSPFFPSPKGPGAKLNGGCGWSRGLGVSHAQRVTGEPKYWIHRACVYCSWLAGELCPLESLESLRASMHKAGAKVVGLWERGEHSGTHSSLWPGRLNFQWQVFSWGGCLKGPGWCLNPVCLVLRLYS